MNTEQEREAFEAWFKKECPVAGINARLSAALAWQARAALAAQPQAAQEPVAVYHGRCVIDCGDCGHHDIEMLRMIPKGAKLYTHPAPQAAQAVPDEIAETMRRALVHFSDCDYEMLKASKKPVVKPTAQQNMDDADAALNWLAAAPSAPAPSESLERDVRAALQMLEDGEWAEHFAKSELGKQLESAITDLHSEIHDARDEAPAAPAQPELTQAARDALAERQRQIEAEGWTHEHDDKHDGGELIDAAISYARVSCPLEGDESNPPRSWPWDESWWKPGDPRRNLMKAIALLLAEAERLDRAAGKDA